MAKTTEGRCLFCGKTLRKTLIKRHLDQCDVRANEYIIKDAEKTERYFCILAQGREDPRYWIYVDMPSKSTLHRLDNFLRDIWLECCGHLSMFKIAGQTFHSNPDREFRDRSMNLKLESVLSPGMQFGYEYDFGSTTMLKLKVVSEFRGNKRGKEVKLLARNIEPVIECDYCGKQATNVCCQCLYDGDAWVCDDCIDKHECEEDMFLPVVNSPRVGVCAYSGSFLEYE
ncbi:MAG TPA: hypothetical protein VLH18_01650 [Candidatus Limnocylindrales bacterium]|nr:hypothetical protein [Candidatus Limnocylindrales bacterium]